MDARGHANANTNEGVGVDARGHAHADGPSGQTVQQRGSKGRDAGLQQSQRQAQAKEQTIVAAAPAAAAAAANELTIVKPSSPGLKLSGPAVGPRKQSGLKLSDPAVGPRKQYGAVGRSRDYDPEAGDAKSTVRSNGMGEGDPSKNTHLADKTGSGESTGPIPLILGALVGLVFFVLLLLAIIAYLLLVAQD